MCASCVRVGALTLDLVHTRAGALLYARVQVCTDTLQLQFGVLRTSSCDSQWRSCDVTSQAK